MWDPIEREKIVDLYQNLDIDEYEIPKIFNEHEWFAINEANSSRNVSRVDNWYRVPKKKKLPCVARFQHLIFDMTHDKSDNAQTDRWREHFKAIINKLAIHPEEINVIQLGFSILAHDPMRVAKKEANPYVYVSYYFLDKLDNLDIRRCRSCPI